MRCMKVAVPRVKRCNSLVIPFDLQLTRRAPLPTSPERRQLVASA